MTDVTALESPIVTHSVDGVTTLVFNRPGTLNALSAELLLLLVAELSKAAADPAVRMIVLTGQGRAFSSGADLTSAAKGKGDTLVLMNQVSAAICAAPKLVIARVNGPAAGVSSSFVMACDLAIASDAAFLKLGFDQLGLIPDGGGTALLPATVGRGRAMQFALLGDRISAADALAHGIYARVWPAADFDREADAFIQRLAAGSVPAMAATKAAVNRATIGPLAEQLEYERTVQYGLITGVDFAEGVAAFREKRPPRFGEG